MSENFVVKNAKYLTSAVDKNNFLSMGDEIAFVGRSNVGKSSLINSLVGQKKLAKTSSTPGLTKMVNYFLINENLLFVDLPGYGFSKTGKSHQKLWSELIDDYLTQSPNLKLVFMLVDIRHEPTELDVLMQKFLYCNNIPYKILATKADKIPKVQLNKCLDVIAKKLQITVNNIIPYSSETRLNKEMVLNLIGGINEQI